MEETSVWGVRSLYIISLEQKIQFPRKSPGMWKFPRKTLSNIKYPVICLHFVGPPCNIQNTGSTSVVIRNSNFCISRCCSHHGSIPVRLECPLSGHKCIVVRSHRSERQSWDFGMVRILKSPFCFSIPHSRNCPALERNHHKMTQNFSTFLQTNQEWIGFF